MPLPKLSSTAEPFAYRDQKTEDLLDDLGLSYKLQWLAMELVDVKKSLRNQVRLKPVEEDLVNQYVEAMKRGAEFPAGAGHLERGQLIVDDGNDLLVAAVRLGRRRMPWYVVAGAPSAIAVFARQVHEHRRQPSGPEGDWRSEERGARRPSARAAAAGSPRWPSPPSTQQKTQYAALQEAPQAPPGPGHSHARENRVEALVEAFLAPHTSATRRAYAQDLGVWLSYCRQVRLEPLAAGRGDVERYVAHLRDAGAAPATMARRLGTLHGLLRYAVEEGLLERSPMLRVRRPAVPRTSPRRGLDRQEATTLLAAAAAADSRTHLLVSLLLLTGVRIQEAVGSSVDDLHRRGDYLVLEVTRKGGHRDRVVLAEYLQSAIHQYLKGRRTGPLLLSRTGRRLDRTNAGRLIKALGRTALPERGDLCPHVLRHAFMQLALQGGATVWDVSRAAGHQDVRVTQRYLINMEQLERSPTHMLVKILAPEAHPTPAHPFE